LRHFSSAGLDFFQRQATDAASPMHARHGRCAAAVSERVRVHPHGMLERMGGSKLMQSDGSIRRTWRRGIRCYDPSEDAQCSPFANSPFFRGKALFINQS
jgi:hypothetical protein